MKDSFLNRFRINNHSSVENLLIFGFCLAVIFGAAFAMFDTYNYDMVANPDIKSYLGLANFDFDQSLIRRYRVIVPFLASGIHYLLGPVFSALKPWSFPGPDFAMCMSFLVVNTVIMAFFGLFVYKLCKAYGVSTLGALTGLLAVLTCRWTAYIAGLPLVDSLYLLVIAMVLLGIKTNNKLLLIVGILLGPWAKESFVFVVPLILIFSGMNRWKLLGLILFSGLLVFSFRYYLDHRYQLTVSDSLSKDVEHFTNIGISLRRLFSFHGVYELFSVTGFWGALFLLLFKKSFRQKLGRYVNTFFILFLVIVLLHALLSTELARMFYLAAPVLAVWLAVITDELLLAVKNFYFRLGN